MVVIYMVTTIFTWFTIFIWLVMVFIYIKGIFKKKIISLNDLFTLVEPLGP